MHAARRKNRRSTPKGQELVDQNEGQVLPLASATWIAWKADKLDQAKIYFEKLRIAAGTANLSTPLLDRLRPLAEQLGFPPEWSIPPSVATDVGPRTPLDLLGPFRWSPYSADDWVLENGDGGIGSMKQFRGKPTILIFYLGFGCLHCVEQLHAFEPKVAQLKQDGFAIAAISTESLASLQTSLQKLEKPLTIPLFADPQSKAFRAYRCMDDFEQLPLHGTFVISRMAESSGRYRSRTFYGCRLRHRRRQATASNLFRIDSLKGNLHLGSIKLPLMASQCNRRHSIPMKLVIERASDIKRSTPSRIDNPATGMTCRTSKVEARTTKPAPVTPAAPFEVTINTPTTVSNCCQDNSHDKPARGRWLPMKDKESYHRD